MSVENNGSPQGATSGSSESDKLRLTVERFVAGGLGLGHDRDGRVVLAEGGLPHDDVEIDVSSAKKNLIRGRVSKVLEASPDRVEPRCPEVERGCGGCDLQHAAPLAQAALKMGIVVDSLARIGKVTNPRIKPGPPLDPFHYRTMLRCGVEPTSGRLGFRSRRSNEIHPVDICLIAHPLAAEIIEVSRFPNATEVTVRVSVATGERVVAVSGSSEGAVVPAGVEVVSLEDPIDSYVHEVVDGRRFRVSMQSFFQSRPDGAAVLVDAVRRAIDGFDPETDRLVDLYGGVGLFTGCLGARHGELVESSSNSTDDAKVNLADLGTRITNTSVEQWVPTPAEVVVADPPRTGLGPAGAAAVLGTGARRVALVSCDPAAMARDVRLLLDGGYELLGVEVIDMFPQTHHVETVAALRLSRSAQRQKVASAVVDRSKRSGNAGPRSKCSPTSFSVPTRSPAPSAVPKRSGNTEPRSTRSRTLAAIAAVCLVVATPLAVACSNTTGGQDGSGPSRQGRPDTSEAGSRAGTSCHPAEPERLDVRVHRRLDHDPDSYTQGLLIARAASGDRVLFESSGLYGRSALSSVSLADGEILDRVALPDDVFAEGIALDEGDELVQLTWKEGRAFRWRADDFDSASDPLGQFPYEGEGWGLTTLDDGRLVMSDGSDRLFVRDSKSFDVLDTHSVRRVGGPADMLNELEWDGERIWANRYHSDEIVRIDPTCWTVDGVADASALRREAEALAAETSSETDVLNGIAFDDETGRYLVTGKLWPLMFEVSFTRR